MAKTGLAAKAVLSNVHITQWAGRRFDREITDEVNREHDAADDAGRYNKLLVDKKALFQIQRIVTEARVYHIKMTQPWSDSGPRILPAKLYLDYTKRMDELKIEFKREVDNFLDIYPSLIAKRQKELNGWFREADYPTPAKLATMFSFDVQIYPCPDADDFRVDLAKEHEDDVRRAIERAMKASLDEAMREPVRRIIATVGRMAERLNAYKPASNGGKAEGIFRDTLVDNVRELAGLLPAFNLRDDPALSSLASRIERDLTVEDASTLRDNDQVRKAVAKSAEEILAEAQALMA